MAGSIGTGPLGTVANTQPPSTGTLAKSAQQPAGVTGGRTYYSESSDPYYRSRGEAAASRERTRFGQRRAAAREQGQSYLEADIHYLLTRRKETLHKWFTLLKWLREGLLNSGDPARKALLYGIRVEASGAQVQTHRADTEDSHSAHLMHCNLRFTYRDKRCEAYDLLQGQRASTQDYQAFVKNIFADTANVFSLINEIDSYLESQGAKSELAAISAQILQQGLEPTAALNQYLESYQALIRRCKDEDYPEVIRRYEAGDNSLEARLAKHQSVSGDMKKHRKRSLFDLYLNYFSQASSETSISDYAYRSRHQEWGTAPNRLL